MSKSRWINNNPKEFVPGDIVCNKEKQDFLRLIVHVDNVAIWCVGLIHCSLSENCSPHPIFPMYFDEIEKGVWEPILKLGNLTDYSNYIDAVNSEVLNMIESVENYNK